MQLPFDIDMQAMQAIVTMFRLRWRAGGDGTARHVARLMLAGDLALELTHIVQPGCQ